MTAEMYLPGFYVKQKITMMINRYEIVAMNPDGSEGQLMALAEQKRLAFKEQVTFFSDAAKTRPVFGFKARKAIDLGSGYDVTDETGRQIGFFKKDFGASLLRSTFHIEGPGFAGTGQERNQVVAMLRRFTDLPFLPVHFDFKEPSGALLMSSERQMSLRDKYTVRVPDQRVDFRVAAAMAVGLDALMAR
ncbi:LURP-one-related/scramblase family protein [Nocardioides pacificus]